MAILQKVQNQLKLTLLLVISQDNFWILGRLTLLFPKSYWPCQIVNSLNPWTLLIILQNDELQLVLSPLTLLLFLWTNLLIFFPISPAVLLSATKFSTLDWCRLNIESHWVFFKKFDVFGVEQRVKIFSCFVLQLQPLNILVFICIIFACRLIL